MLEHPTTAATGLRDFAVIAITSLAFSAGPAFATITPVGDDGAGGVERQGMPMNAGQTDGPVEVSRGRFETMAGYQIRDLNRARRKGKKIQIDGFSTVMSGWLVYMADADRRRTQRLLREMGEIDKPKDRKKRLERALDQARDFEANLEASIERLRARKLWGAVADEQSRLGRLREFIDGLEVWVDYPHEGTR